MDETSTEAHPQPEERGVRTPEAALSPETELTPRERRIVEEETRLVQRPDQRRANVLDYLRRGRLKDARVSIHPDLIQLLPKLLESDVIDFSAPTYDEQATIQQIVEACADVLRDASDIDDEIRRQLAIWRVTGPDGHFLDAAWAAALQKQLDAYAAQATRPNPKHPLAGDQEAYRADVRKRWTEKFSAVVKGQIDHFMDAAEAGGVRFDLPTPEPSKDPVAAFLRKETGAQKESLQKYPSLETYRGETVSSPPDFRAVKVKPGLRISERDEVPAHGGFIFDGNFGYSPDGELIKPANTEIIDHHDALNEKQYDTATIMASRTWERRLGQKFTNRGWADELRNLKKGGFFDGEGKHLITMVNDPDTDAMLALWVFRNPRRAEQYTTILNNISTCGDFLVGSRIMEYGATARDYNYIIMNYLEACKRKILEEKREDAAKSGEVYGAVIGAIRERREEIVRESPELLALQQEADTLRGEKEMSKEAQRARGMRIAEITKRLEQAVKEALGPVLIAQEQEAQAALAGVQKNVSEMDGVLSSKRDIKLSPEENAKIVSHFLDRMEDIVTNPFKYKKYLLAGREKEERGFQQVEQWYRSGEMEIRPYEKDPDIIMILPQEGKRLRAESVDGMYFFLRRRVDFNKRIIATLEGPSVLVAINTQNQAELRRYDFNVLLDQIRPREKQALEEKKAEATAALARTTDKKERVALERQIKQADTNLARLKEGKLWRNRNQLAFCNQSSIPREEFLEMLDAWKRQYDVAPDMNKRKKR